MIVPSITAKVTYSDSAFSGHQSYSLEVIEFLLCFGLTVYQNRLLKQCSEIQINNDNIERATQTSRSVQYVKLFH